MLSLEWNLVGRREEVARLETVLDETLEGRSSTTLVSGEVGIGKTRIIEETLKAAEGKGYRVLQGVALEEASLPFSVFSRALSAISEGGYFQEREGVSFQEVFALDESGIVIAKANVGDEELDPQILSGMVSAVQSFIKDSFDPEGGHGTLGRLEYGDYKILVEYGQKLYLTGVVKGAEHPDMQRTLKSGLKDLEKSFSNEEGLETGLGELLNKRFLVRRSLEGVDLELERVRISEEILDTLRQESLKVPLLLILEDLHWADDSSIFVLNYLARSLKDERVAIIGTARPKENELIVNFIEKAGFEGHIGLMELASLRQKDVESLISELFPNNKFSPDFINEISEKSEGNPFFTIEMLRGLESGGNIVMRNDAYETSEQDFTLPETLEDVVRKRLAVLDNQALAVAEYASCIGKEIDGDALGSIQIEGIAEALEMLNAVGLIKSVGGVDQFSHAVFHNVIYDSLSPRWKNLHHKRLGEYYEFAHPDDLDPVIYEVARHFSNTNEHFKKYEYCKRAGEKAESSFSPDLALDYYTKSLNAVPALTGEVPKAAVFELEERLGQILGLLGRYQDSFSTYERAIEAAPTDLDKARVNRKLAYMKTLNGKFDESLNALESAEKLLGGEEDAELGFIHVARSFNYLNKGDFEKAIELSHKGIDLLEKVDGEEAQKVMARAWKIIGSANLYKSNYDEALGNHLKGLEIGERLGDLYGVSASYNNMGNVYLAWGNFDKAHEHYIIALDMFGKIKDLQGKTYALNNMGIICKNRGDYEGALKYYEECLQIMEKMGDLTGFCYIYSNIGNVYSEMGEYERAKKAFEESLALAEKMGDKTQIVSQLVGLGGAFLDLGDVAESKKLIEKAHEISIQIGSKRSELWAMRTLARIAFKEGDTEKAETLFKGNLDAFTEVGMDVERAYTLVEHARMKKELGEFGAGRKMLEEAMEIFEARGMASQLKKAQNVLDSLED